MLRRKATIAFAVSIIAAGFGMSTVQADLNVGRQIETWYESAFAKTSMNLKLELASHSTRFAANAAQLRNELLGSSRAKINEVAETANEQMDSRISEQETAYINQAADALNLLTGTDEEEGWLEERFQESEEELKTQIQTELEQSANDLMDDLNAE